MHGFDGRVNDYTECLVAVGIMARITTKQYNLDTFFICGDLALNKCYDLLHDGVEEEEVLPWMPFILDLPRWMLCARPSASPGTVELSHRQYYINSVSG